ncbi:TPA: ATP-binding protein, partial [Clostridium perfringens]|nr:ATP-binding protein [Clostridium perfringens]
FFYTSKANKENHGFGISSVKNIISKYNGNIFFYINKNEFEVNFRIKIKE